MLESQFLGEGGPSRVIVPSTPQRGGAKGREFIILRLISSVLDIVITSSRIFS